VLKNNREEEEEEEEGKSQIILLLGMVGKWTASRYYIGVAFRDIGKVGSTCM
jgi:hypothetical protein